MMRSMRAFVLWVFVAACSLACSPVHAKQPLQLGQLSGSFRKDFFLPYDVYPEYHQPAPIHGGRVHVIATIPKFKPPLSSVKVNGQEMLDLPTSNFTLKYFDWGKAWYSEDTQQFHAAFHSRNDAWFAAKNFTVDVADAAGSTASGWYIAEIPQAIVTWVTPLNPQGTRWIVHITNNGTTTTNVTSIHFNGKRPQAVSSSLPRTLRPSDRLVLVLNTTTSNTRGTPFTLQVGFGAHQSVAYGARTPETRFPVEVWPRSSDCPVPTINDKAHEHIASHGIDTVFYGAGNFAAKCGASFANTANALSVSHPDFYFWTDPDSLKGLNASAIQQVSAAFLADENDGELDANLRQTVKAALDVAKSHPSVLTYQGGKTNRHNGAYAGICDIQGLDFYVAACAPTIIPVTVTLPLQGSYAYLRNARNNQMPLPSMLYSQLYGGWDVEPHANEIIVQLASVLLAGAKGLTLFQSVEDEFAKQSHDWNGPLLSAMSSITHPQVKHVLRTGDIDGLPFTSSDKGNPIKSIKSLTQVIRNDEYILIVVASFDAEGYNNLLCHVYASAHWLFKDHTVEKVHIQLTDNVSVSPHQVAQAMEVSAGKLVPLTDGSLNLKGGALVLKELKLSQNMPLRLLLVPYTLV